MNVAWRAWVLLTLVRVKKLAYCVSAPSIRSAARMGVMATVEHGHLRRLPVSHVLDVGANRGQFSAQARQLFSNAPIDSFEPLDAPFVTLDRYSKSSNRHRVHQVAISDFVGRAEIQVASDDDSSSLLGIGERQVELHRGSYKVGVEPCDVSTLDCWTQSNSLEGSSVLLKIDVQGAELRVLLGAVKMLELVRFVYVEASYVELYEGQELASEVIDELSKLGFALVGVHNSSYGPSGESIQADFLFEKSGIVE